MRSPGTPSIRPRARRALGLLRVLAGLVPSLLVAACGDVLTDAATRLGTDVVRHADALRKSTESELTFVHQPKSSPEGCKGSYGITFQESLHHPASGGALVVRCGEEDAGPGYSYSTTYHLNAVRVPAELSIEKTAGADLTLTLRKNGDAIDLVRLE
jgi:hypothetical protein